MKKKILIGSILAVALLVLVSFSSAVGYSSIDKNPVPDLDCIGDLYWIDVVPGATVTGRFTVENIGEPESLLNWEIESYPDWGIWTLDPDGWTGLLPGAPVLVDVEIVLPDEIEEDLMGEVLIVNLENSSDYCIIDAWMRVKSIDDATTVELKFQRIKELIQSIDLRNVIVNPYAEVETFGEILSILEKENTRNYIEKSSEEDCDCEKPNEWGFPMICTALLSMMGVVFIPWMMLMIIFMIPPNALDEMLELLFLMLSPVLILWERFNCSLPEVNHPFPSNETPADGEQNVSLDLTELSFQLTDKDTGYFGLMSYKVTTSPNIGEGEYEWVPSGTYTIPVHGLKERTTYKWQLLLYAGDFDETPMSHRYTFTTESFTPIISNPSPLDIAEFLPLNTSNISFDLVEPQHELMNWTVETQPDIGSGAETGVIDGRYTVPISGLDYFTTYNWFVNVTDGTHWSKETFSFRTTTENTVVIEPTDDATISDPDENVNFGTSESLRLRSIGGGWDLEALIKFNLSAVPSNVTIRIAGLKAFYYRYEEDDPSRNKVNLYRNKNDWDEETVTWNNKPSHITEPSSIARIPATINNWIFWNVTGDTEMFYNNSTINYGWRIKDMSGYYQNEEPYFRSKEYIEYHPHLIIGYE